MNCKIKEKIVDGKKVKGVINDSLKGIVPFEFKDIVEFQYNEYYSYFICIKEDGASGLYDSQGECLLDYSLGYKNLRIPKCALRNPLVLIADKDDKVGILKPKSNQEPEILYHYGECDEIKELENGNVQLIKHTENGDKLGYWYHEDIREFIPPVYSRVFYDTIKCPRLGLYRYRDVDGKTRTDIYQKSERIEDERLTFNVEVMEYSKLIDNMELFGVKQKVKNGRNYEFQDLISCEYNSISYNESRQMFFITKNVNGKSKCGLKGVTFDWKLSLKCCYPNLKVAVDIPCIYDSLKFIDDNYILTKNDDKYGLIYFSFSKTIGDYDSFNRYRHLNAKNYEVVPCNYDNIEKLGDVFIGSKNQEKEIITGLVSKDNKSVIVSGNYKMIKLLSNKLFLCELENGKQEVVYLKKDNLRCEISKISCDDAKLIQNYYGSLLVISNDKVNNVYCFDYDKNLMMIEENVSLINYDETPMCKITKNNGHVRFVGYNGKTFFSSEEIGLNPSDISVEYLEFINKFKVRSNNKIRIYSDFTSSKENVYDGREFSSFNVINKKLVFYREIIDDAVVSKICKVNPYDNYKETELMVGNFQVVSVVLDGKRIIISNILENGSYKFGVIETREGNACIDFIYDSIEYDKSNQVFICTLNDEVVILDNDGFVCENQDVAKHILKNFI